MTGLYISIAVIFLLVGIKIGLTWAYYYEVDFFRRLSNVKTEQEYTNLIEEEIQRITS